MKINEVIQVKSFIVLHIKHCNIFTTTPFFNFFFFLGPHLQHMEVPRLGAELELQLPAYTTAIATWDPNHIC